MSDSLTPASLIAMRQGSIVRSIELVDERLELGARELHRQVLRARLVGRDVRQVDVGLLRRRELDLRLFGGLLEALQREHVVLEVDAGFLLELGDDVVDHALVEVLAAQERVAVGRQHLELVLLVDLGDLDDRDVERAAAQVVHRDLAIAFLLVHAERERGRRRLVDDPLDLEPGDLAGVLGRLPLRVVEVRRHRDDGLGHFLAEVVLRGLLHLAQDFGRHLRRRDLLAAHLDPRVAVVVLDDLVGHEADVLLDFLFLEPPPDQPLDGEDRVLGVGDRLPLGRRADQDFAVFLIGDDRRRRARAFGVLDHLGLPAFHDGDAAVGRAEVDADDLAHDSLTSGAMGCLRCRWGYRPPNQAARRRPAASTKRRLPWVSPRRPSPAAARGRPADSPSGTPARPYWPVPRFRPSPSPDGGADRISGPAPRFRRSAISRTPTASCFSVSSTPARSVASEALSAASDDSSESFTARSSAAKRSMPYLCARATSAVACLRMFSRSARERSHASRSSAASASSFFSSGGDIRRGVGRSGVADDVAPAAAVTRRIARRRARLRAAGISGFGWADIETPSRRFPQHPRDHRDTMGAFRLHFKPARAPASARSGPSS